MPTGFLKPGEEEIKKKDCSNSGGGNKVDDPRITLYAVVIGGLIAGVSNLLLQSLSFHYQNKRSLDAERISAYNSLLGHISNYESDPNGGEKFIPDMGYKLSQAFSFGSPEIKALVVPEIVTVIKKNEDFDKSIAVIKETIVREIMDEKSKWQSIKMFLIFWK